MNKLKVALAQIAPIWLNKERTIQKVEKYIHDAGEQGCDLVVFGEAIIPGYPFWLSNTDGSAFNNQRQKEIHAHYVKNSVEIEKGDLDSLCAAAKKHNIAVYVGTMERAQNRGGHSIYCSLVYIDKTGEIKSVHRKLMPTYEERLTWAAGDGNGLQVHDLPPFRVGGLNCWENWLPLARTALYAQGENLHVAVWPGAKRNTDDLTLFIAKESRSYVISVSGLMTKNDFPKDTPHYDFIMENAPEVMADGGSCISDPSGNWVIEPIVKEEGLFTAELDFNRVLEERQNLDVCGHYSRPDVTKLVVNRERQTIIKFENE